MSDNKTAESKAYDPLESMRLMRDTYMSMMSKSMIDTVNSDAYASANGTLLENTLTLTAPMREAFNKSMLQALQQLSLPSRDDVLGLAGRFTNFEMRLDDLDAAIGALASSSPASGAAASDAPGTLPAILEQIRSLGTSVENLGRRMEALESKLEAALEERVQTRQTAAPAAELPVQTPAQPAAAHAGEPNSAARRKAERVSQRAQARGAN